jgi:uncharacterized protein (TIGR03086 family)
MSADERLEPLHRALDQTGRLIAGARPEQSAWPTPCKSWNVQALVSHVVDETLRFASVSGGPPKGEPVVDLAPDVWAVAYERAAATLRAAWDRPGAVDETQDHPFGERPALWAVHQQTSELVTHAWDVARATGQPTDFDPDIGRLALDFLHDNMRPEFRGDEKDGFYIGKEVDVDDRLPLYDRIAAFNGRNPRWTSLQTGRSA